MMYASLRWQSTRDPHRNSHRQHTSAHHNAHSLVPSLLAACSSCTSSCWPRRAPAAPRRWPQRWAATHRPPRAQSWWRRSASCCVGATSAKRCGPACRSRRSSTPGEWWAQAACSGCWWYALGWPPSYTAAVVQPINLRTRTVFTSTESTSTLHEPHGC